jgi:hypothetical protein
MSFDMFTRLDSPGQLQKHVANIVAGMATQALTGMLYFTTPLRCYHGSHRGIRSRQALEPE